MQVKKDKIRNKILRKAKREFLENGFLNASLRKIARDSELAPANLYRYFRNKEELYIIITLQFNQERVDFVYNEMRKGKTFEEKLRNFCYGYLEYAKNNIEIFRLSMFYQLNGLNEELFSDETKQTYKDHVDKNTGEFMDILEGGVKSNEFEEIENYDYFITTFTMSVRMALNEVVLLKYRDETFYQHYIDFLFKGLLKRRV